jgi:hypothetical protein
MTNLFLHQKDPIYFNTQNKNTYRLALLLINSSGPLFNLIQMAILSLMAVTAIFAANRLKAAEQLI